MRIFWTGFVISLTFATSAFAIPPVFLEQSDTAKAKAAADDYRVEEAVALYTKVIEAGNLTPEELAAAHTGRAAARENYTVAYGIKDSEMLLALADYKQARKLWRTSQAYRNEAGAFIILGAYADATAAYRLALPLEKPEPHWSLIGLARTERIQGHYDAAMTHLDEALRLAEAEGGSMPIYYHRGYVFYEQAKFAAAAESFSNGIPKQPDYAFAHKFRACAYAQLGEYTKALADAEQSIKLFEAVSTDEDAWMKTPYGKATREDFATNLAAIKAMAAGAAIETNRALLCKNTWNDGEDKRDRSPLLIGDQS